MMHKEDLLSALKNRDFEAVAGLAKQFRDQMAQDLKAAPTAEIREEIYQNSLDFVQNALHLARVMRAHISSELHANSASFLYENAGLEQHRWQIRA